MNQLQPALFGGQGLNGQNVRDLMQLRLAQTLLQSGSDTSPIQSPWQGAARLAQALAGGYIGHRLGQEQTERQAGAADTLEQAMRAGKTEWTNPDTGQVTPTGGGQEAMVRVLMQNPNTAAYGANMQMEGMKQRQQLANELLKAREGKKLALEYDPQIAASTSRATIPVDVERGTALAPVEANKARLVAEAQAPTQMRVGAANAYASANAGLSVAGAKTLAEEEAKRKAAGGGFSGTDLKAQANNIMAAGEAKMAGGQQLTPQEQYQYDQAKRILTQETVLPSPDGNFVAVPAQPLPVYGGAQPAPAAPGASGAAPSGAPDPRAPRPLTGVLKRVPDKINEGMLENAKNLREAETMLAELEKYPSAVGGAGGLLLPDIVRQRTDPEGVAARAAISKMMSTQIHDLTGAAQSVTEVERLKPFIINMSDRPEVAMQKARNFVKTYREILKDQADTYGVGQGYMGNPVVNKALGAPAAGGWKIEKVQ